MASQTLNKDKFEAALFLKGLTRAQFAEAAGISHATLTAINKGRPITAASAFKIVDALLNLPDKPGLAEMVEQAS